MTLTSGSRVPPPVLPAPKPRDQRLDGMTPLQRTKARLHLDHLEDVVQCECVKCWERDGEVRRSDRGVVGPNHGGESARSWGDSGRRDDPSDDGFWEF